MKAHRLITPLLALLLFGSSAAFAKATVDDARALVIDTTEKVLERLRSDQERLKAEPDLIYPLVEDLVLPHFDFYKMSQWVLGKNWRQADTGQKQRFTDEFRTLLVRTYAKALLEYTDQKLDYLPIHAKEGSSRVTVKTEIAQAGGNRIPLNYSMYLNKAGAWKVYDISVDGVSLVTNYRTSFATQIKRDGMEKLIEDLHQRNASATDSAPDGAVASDNGAAGE